ncbi:MAG TPA: nucleoside triphosphate pyrophosphohydrolase [Pseudobdellovibrionaceae bacterium]|jgi:tetrapyrrole methylase family protein/MazG family protein
MPKGPENLKDIRECMQVLMNIVTDLRGPNGCPWDKEQTHNTLARYAIEETFEMVEALEEREDCRRKLGQAPSKEEENKNRNSFVSLSTKFKEELGDVLFQVVLHSQLASEEGSFDFSDVVISICEKLVRRHPHVFGDVIVKNSEDVIKNWNNIKKEEKAKRGEKASLISVPPGLPALQRAFTIGEKTHRINFDWQGPQEVWLKVEEEIAELQEAIDNDVMSEIEHELGDVLFSLAQLARHYELDPEQVLRAANTRFLGRFEKMIGEYRKAKANTSDVDEVLKKFGALSTEEKENFWELAKRNFGG